MNTSFSPLRNVHYIAVSASKMSRVGFRVTVEERAIVVAIYQNGQPAAGIFPVGAGYHPAFAIAPAYDYVALRAGETSGGFQLYYPGDAMLVILSAGQQPPILTVEPVPLPFPADTDVIYGPSLYYVEGSDGFTGTVTFSNGATGPFHGPLALNGAMTGGTTWAEARARGMVFTPQ